MSGDRRDEIASPDARADEKKTEEKCCYETAFALVEVSEGKKDGRADYGCNNR